RHQHKNKHHSQSMTSQRSTTRVSATTVSVTAALCGGSFFCGSAAAAEEPAPPKKGWETVASAGVTLTRGNSETFLGTVGINSQRKWSSDEILLGASGGYGENTTFDREAETE